MTVRRRVAVRLANEVRWLCSDLSYRWQSCRRRRLVIVLAALACLVILVADDTWLRATVVGAALGPLAWARFAPRSYLRFVRLPGWRRRTEARIRRLWPILVVELGLVARQDHSCPALGRAMWSSASVRFAFRPLVGQTVQDFRAQAVRIAESLGVLAAHFGGDSVELTFLDPLQLPQERPVLDSTHIAVQTVPMGVREDGEIWYLRIAGTHTLVAGCSGAGKASLVWGVAIGLAPAVRAGLVQVWGLDLKGGMELAMGRPLFAALATSPRAAVDLLEEAVRQMHERASRLAGHVRTHAAVTGDPLVVVLIDEVAAITSYLNDRDLKRRANDALALLCSQGRALGFSVVACLQDPRKEVLGVRNLLTQVVGLRLRDREESTMVLGGSAVDAGAGCHEIPQTAPGLAYVLPDDGGAPQRVRAWFIDDRMIRWAADAFPSPVRVVPAPTESTPTRPRSRSAA